MPYKGFSYSYEKNNLNIHVHVCTIGRTCTRMYVLQAVHVHVCTLYMYTTVELVNNYIMYMYMYT